MSSDYTIQNLDALRADFIAAANDFPYESEKKLKSLGNKFKRIVLSKTPTGGKTVKARTVLKSGEKLEKKEKGTFQRKSSHALDKSYETEIKGYGEYMQLNFQSTAPHFHLIERGHKKVAKDGREYGFTPGAHMVEKTAQEFEGLVPKEVEKFLQKTIDKMRT